MLLEFAGLTYTILVYCVSGALAILSDMIVIAVTWYRTHSFGKRARHNRTPFIRMIFRDGKTASIKLILAYLIPFWGPFPQARCILCKPSLLSNVLQLSQI